MSSVALGALCCFALFAVINYTGEASGTGRSLLSVKNGADTNAVVPEMDFTEVTDAPAEDAPAAAAEEGPDVLSNIVDLKAYCLAAYDDANIVMQNHKNLAAMADFVHAYGINGGGDDIGGRKAEVDNIVTEYAQTMAGMKAKYGHGVNMYILDHLDKSVRHEVGGPVFTKLTMSAMGGGGRKGRKFGQLAGLKYASLGLEDQPAILVELAAKYSKFLTFKAHVSTQASDADVVAATMFLQSKSFGHYQSFLQREIAKVQKKMKSEANYVAHLAFDAEQAAFKESYEHARNDFFNHVAKQSTAGRVAAKTAAAEFPWTPPSLEEMKAIAHNHSVAFMHEFSEKHADPAALLRRITDESGGVKLFITTTGATDAQSTMKPTITINGHLSTIEKEIRAVPGQGATFVQHIPAHDALGAISSIVLTGTGDGLRWNCAGIKLRSGGVDEHIVNYVTGNPDPTFWLESGDSIELFPEDVPDEDGTDMDTTEGCKSWRATEECSGKGARDEMNDKDCTEDIDSSMSGYCECSGAKSKAVVDCGHDSFTCEEICQI